jgi:hypothetical protein
VAGLAAFWDLTRDVRIELRSVLAREPHGGVGVSRVSGTLPEGGDFEIYSIDVVTVSHGRITSLEHFELADAEAALARFAELRPDPLRIPPNAATRASDRWHEAAGRGDRKSVEALFAPTLVFEDRRRGVRTSGGRELLLANERAIGTLEPKPDWTRSVLATAGDRLALWRSLVAGTYEGGSFEVEFLQVLEVDGDGRVVANVVFDPDDLRAASVEMMERHLRQLAGSIPSAGIEAMRAFLDHDLERLRAFLPDDFYLDDHRRTGVGRIEGADAFLASLVALFEQAPDLVVESLYGIDTHARGILEMAHIWGTLAASDGAFEGFYVRLLIWAGERLVGFELFEPEDLDRARARFAELGAEGVVAQTASFSPPSRAK